MLVSLILSCVLVLVVFVLLSIVYAEWAAGKFLLQITAFGFVRFTVGLDTTDADT